MDGYVSSWMSLIRYDTVCHTPTSATEAVFGVSVTSFIASNVFQALVASFSRNEHVAGLVVCPESCIAATNRAATFGDHVWSQ